MPSDADKFGDGLYQVTGETCPVDGCTGEYGSAPNTDEKFCSESPGHGSASEDAEILDSTCGGRSIWMPGQKENENALYIDKREREPGFTGQEGRTFSVEPDEIEDFRDLPYEDESFNLVVFDPPHVVRENGMENLTGYVTKSYGALRAETWQSDLRQGFEELWRVLSRGGTLVFKFADNDVDFREVLDLAPADPLFGTTTKKNSKVENRWFVFYKEESADE